MEWVALRSLRHFAEFGRVLFCIFGLAAKYDYKTHMRPDYIIHKSKPGAGFIDYIIRRHGQ